MGHARKVVLQREWLTARTELLAKEKELTRLKDELSAEVQRLPMVKVEKDYLFEGTGGTVRLADLFGPYPQLMVYHFMFDPAWEEGCKSCSHVIDNVAGSVVHLAARQTAFAVVSKAPIAKIDAFKKRMGWNFPWVSSNLNDFNHDFRVTIDPAADAYEYNFSDAKTLLAQGKIWFEKGELPGLSVFLRDADAIYRTYSTYQRGLDIILNTYNLLDMTPMGRHEEDAPGQSWIRHHDKYPNEIAVAV